MSVSEFYYAREDNVTAANDAVNVFGSTIYTLQFSADSWQNLSLTYVPDGADAGTTPDFDPDTQVIINNQTYNFAVIKSGTLPVASVPPELQGKIVYVIKIDFDQDGDLEGKGDLQLFFTTDPAGTPENMAQIGNGALTLGSVDFVPDPEPVCFSAGTGIATPSGSRPVETLRPGDLVLTEGGRAVQVVWVGLSHFSAAQLAENPAVRPIRIPAHAVRPGCPERDLDLSPQHRIVLDGPACELLFGLPRVFVVANHLVGTLAEVVEDAEGVTYVHLLLEEHEILLGNGLPSESFQPARRVIEGMTGPARAALDATLAVLGAEAMLSRPDALPTLRSPEARVLLHRLVRPFVGRTPGSSVVQVRH